MADYIGRRTTFAREITARGFDAALVTSMPNMRYLSGFTGDSGMLIVTSERCFLLSDFRYREQAAMQAPDYEYQEFSRGREYALCAEIVSQLRVQRIGLEKDTLSLSDFSDIQAALGDGKAYDGIDGILYGQRAVKEPGELQAMQEAGALTDQAFSHILTLIKPGVSEMDIALELEYHMRKRGASGVSFAPIVAFGENGSRPHAVPGMRKAKDGDLITMDFGCVVDGYCSDMTRTIALGALAQEQRNVYNICLEAQKRAVSEIRCGIMGKQADAVARELISRQGYGECFGHGLGHGVGIEIHEAPTLNASSRDVLKARMIVTVEPGIYLAGRFGVRIEDFGVITDEGYVSYVHSPKELIQLSS